MEAGSLDPALASIVFSLEEGRLSEPVATAQGIHLFLVSGIMNQRTIPFEEVRSSIEERLTALRKEALVEELAAGLPEVKGSFVVERSELEALLQHGDVGTEVVRMGDYRLSLVS